MVLQYKYLIANLLGLLPLVVAISFAHQFRISAVICGVVLGLFSPLSYLSERVYWTPERIMGGGLGIEDVIFCFHTGAMSWLCAVWPWGNKVQINAVTMVVIRRLASVSLFAIIALSCLLWFGAPIMLAFTLVQATVATILVTMRPVYLRFAFTGLPLFTLYYFLLRTRPAEATESTLDGVSRI